MRQANWPASFGNKAWKTDTSLRSIRNQAGSKKPRSDSAASASHLALGVLKLQMRTPEPPTPVSGFLLGFWVKFRLPGLHCKLITRLSHFSSLLLFFLLLLLPFSSSSFSSSSSSSPPLPPWSFLVTFLSCNCQLLLFYCLFQWFQKHLQLVLNIIS